VAYKWADRLAFVPIAGLSEPELLCGCPFAQRRALRRGCQRLRVGQIPYSWVPEAVAALVQQLSGCTVVDVETHLANGRPSGLMMMWVEPNAVNGVLAIDRTFLCDLSGAWFLRDLSDWKYAMAGVHDGHYRAGVAKCPATIGLPDRFDRLYD